MNKSYANGGAAALGEAAVFGNWSSSSPPPAMPFQGLQHTSSSYKQFYNWSNTTHNDNPNNSSSHQHHHGVPPPYFADSPTDIGFSCSSSSSPAPAAAIFAPFYSQISQFSEDQTAGFLKKEEECFGGEFGSQGKGRIGLNLGHRTYFSDSISRRPRGFYPASQVPRCQAEGCNVDLTNAKHYHRRHRVCDFHSKATRVVLAGGLEQRFCQQCSRFHALTEFDEVKRSCRKRLADHNRRRRKPQPGLTEALPATKPPQYGIEENQESGKITKESFCALAMARDSKPRNEELQQMEQKAVVTHMQKGPDLSLSRFEISEKCPETQLSYTHRAFSSPYSLFDRELQPVQALFRVDDHDFDL